MALPTTEHLHFLFIVPRICTDNDAPQITPLFPRPEDERCLSSLNATKDAEKLSYSVSHFLLVQFFFYDCIWMHPQNVIMYRCHLQPLGTIWLSIVLFWYLAHLTLWQFAHGMFHCCGKCQYACTGKVPVFSTSFLFSVFTQACLSKHGFSPAAAGMQIQIVSSTRGIHVSALCPAGGGSCNKRFK